jgi:hypothetical protein
MIGITVYDWNHKLIHHHFLETVEHFDFGSSYGRGEPPCTSEKDKIPFRASFCCCYVGRIKVGADAHLFRILSKQKPLVELPSL